MRLTNHLLGIRYYFESQRQILRVLMQSLKVSCIRRQKKQSIAKLIITLHGQAHMKRLSFQTFSSFTRRIVHC